MSAGVIYGPDKLTSGNMVAKLGNVGLIFTKGDLKEVSDEVAKYKVCFTFSCLVS